MTETGVPNPRREVVVERLETGRYVAINARGGRLEFGATKDGQFSPVELLLAAIGGCSGVDIDVVTSRRAEPEQFQVAVSADKATDEAGATRLDDVVVDFRVKFADDEPGRQATDMIERLIKHSRDKDCTVSLTVEAPTHVTFTRDGVPVE